MKGKLIVIEGTDCSGKETQSNLLVEFLKEQNIKVKKFAFPNYNSPTGKIIAGPFLGKEGYIPPFFPEGASNVDPYCSCLLYAMDRKYNIGEIETALNDGYNVILDRYTQSNMAHQGAKLDDNKQEKIFTFIEKLEFDLLNLPKPDLMILLHMPSWAGKILKTNRREKLDQNEIDDIYMQKAEQTYLKLAKRENAILIECTENDKILSVEEINKKLQNSVCEFLKK